MEVAIWSDIRCPFCYIGKRRFELALERFGHRDQTRVVWHSFELDPKLKTQPSLGLYDYIGKIKGLSRKEVLDLHVHVGAMAEQAGLRFNFERAIVANSFDGHRLIQFAKSKGRASDAEEVLFRAHFTEGKNIDDPETLVELGVAAGLEESAVREAIRSDAFGNEVREDEAAAGSIGIRGVPFFIFNGKYAVSGAQSVELFLQALETSWEDFEKENPPAITEGVTCTPEGDCG